jgi:murein DD-endopeptidase MepM/ murein hydrolase activator NlpD
VTGVTSRTITFLENSPDPGRKSRTLVQQRPFAQTEVERAVGANFTIYEIQGGPPPKPAPKDDRIVLQWPLATPRSSLAVSQPFDHDPWAGKTTCSIDGERKIHNGTDYALNPAVNLARTAVRAPEDGYVKKIHLDSSGYRYAIVMEHNHPSQGKFTTVIWHVEPSSGIAEGKFVSKGTQIATVANMGTDTHFHMALRLGAYDGTAASYSGALPRINCDGYPAHPARFINVEKSPVLFQ